MKSTHTGTEAHGHPSSATPRPASPSDVLDVLADSVARTAVSQTKTDPKSQLLRSRPNPAENCSPKKCSPIAGCAQPRGFSAGAPSAKGRPYLKIVWKVLYRLKDIEAYEEASLVRKTF